MRIPSDIEQATADLNGIESLLTRKGWERAAIVAAFVRLDNRPGPRSVTSDRSPAEFAALGIAGLRSKNTVQGYVQNWIDEHGGVYPEPGDEVTLPDKPWPPLRDERGNTQEELIRSAARAGTLVGKLTPEQKAEVAAEILDEAEVPEVVVKAARAAVDRHVERQAEEHGLNQPVDDHGMDMLAVEAQRLRRQMSALGADVRRLHDRAESDQWDRLVEVLADGMNDLTASVFGSVPDNLEGIES